MKDTKYYQAQVGTFEQDLWAHIRATIETSINDAALLTDPKMRDEYATAVSNMVARDAERRVKELRDQILAELPTTNRLAA